MNKRVVLFFVNVFILVFLYGIVNFANPARKNFQQENHPPVVKISTPSNGSFYQWNTSMKYIINVRDEEDGDSKFDEIPSNEVFLRVKYVADTSKPTREVLTDPPGLAAIKSSNCLNCHAFNGKLIGPSFYDVSKRYPYKPSNIQSLEKHIKEGSTGVWGNVSMPTHPELATEKIQDMVDWILKNGAEQDVYYFRGTEGTFRIKPPVAPAPKGGLILTASYTDHGIIDKPKQNLRAQDVMILRVK